VNGTYQGDLKAGVVYTHRTEIDLMCRLSLTHWLANHLGAEHKDLLYNWVFAFGEEEKQEADAEVAKANLWQRLDGLVGRVRVCDPACGSGAFLVGMMLVLDDLQARCNAALGISHPPYERRKRILRDQLYGVDVMEWAVRVAELRLWLQLAVETEIPKDERKFKPLLPNLDLKLRPGDSLLQTVGDLDLSPFRRSELAIPRGLKKRITELRRKKQRFFQGEDRSVNEALLKNEELRFFRDILTSRIHELENQIQRKRQALEEIRRQGEFEGFVPTSADTNGKAEKAQERLEAKIRELTRERERYQRALEALKPDQPPPFVWDLAFVEIFEDDNPGFDIVIGNPPYVRKEKIRDYLDRFDRKEYLNRLKESLRAIYPTFMGKERRISGRADYYVYFYLHAMSLLADRGTFCFITSNSWLDADFGKDLQEFFLRHGQLKMVIDNHAKRSFPQADVNTVIVLAGRPEQRRALTEKKTRKRLVRFVAFRVPFEEAVSPVIFSEIEDDSLYETLANFRVLKRPEFRSVLWDQRSLLREGVASDASSHLVDLGKYEGNKWGGLYLRAPDIVLKRLMPQLERLETYASIEGYIHGNNVGPQFPRAYFISSIQDVETIYVDTKSPGVRLYGVRESGNSRLRADLLYPRMTGDRFLVLYVDGAIYGQKFYKIIFNDRDLKEIMAAYLNSTLAAAMNEVFGNVPWGLGAVSVNSYDVKRLRVVRPCRLSADKRWTPKANQRVDEIS